MGALISRMMPEWSGMHRELDERSNSNWLLTLFNTMIIGTTTVVPVFAIIWTRGNSIMWLAIILWIVYAIFLRKGEMESDSSKKSIPLFSFSAVVVLLVGIFASSYYMFFVRAGGELCGDFLYYGNASCVMMHEHVETASFASLFHYPEPYHYGELWLTVLCSTIFGLKPIFVLLLVSYPLFCFMLILGVAALCKELTQMHDIQALVLGVCLLFFMPVVSLLIPWMRTPIASPKNLVILVFLVWGMLMLLKRDFPKAFVAFCMLVPFYSTVAPGVLTFVFLLSIVLQCKESGGWKRLWNKYAVITVCLAISFGVFYLVQKKSPIEEPVRYLYEGNWTVNALSFAAKRSLRYLILLLPTAFILLYYTRKKRYNSGIWKGFGCLVASILVSCLIGGFMREISRDGGQITTNYVENMLFIVCFCAMVFVVFKVAEKLHQFPKWMFCFLFLLYPLLEGKASIADNNNYPVGNSGVEKFFLTRELLELKNRDVKSAEFRPPLNEKGEINWHQAFPIMPHILKSGYYAPYNFSELDLPKDYPAVLDDSHHHAFWQYVYFQKGKGTFVSNEQSMLDFVKDMGIEYIIVNQGTYLPTIFVKKTTLVTKSDGDTLYILK
jgi:hypothetical protein